MNFITIKLFKNKLCIDYFSGTVDQIRKEQPWIGKEYDYSRIDMIVDSADNIESVQSILDSLKPCFKEKTNTNIS